MKKEDLVLTGSIIILLFGSISPFASIFKLPETIVDLMPYFDLKLFQQDLLFIKEIEINATTIELNYLSFLFYLLLLTGIILWLNGQDKHFSLIKFSLSLFLLFQIFDFVTMLNQSFLDTTNDFEMVDNKMAFFISDIIWGGVTFYSILLASQVSNKNTDTNIESDDDFHIEEINLLIETKPVGKTPAEKALRLINHVVDSLVIYLIFSSNLKEGFGGVWLLICIVPISYILFESFFSATPGKFLTKTKVVNLDDEKATFNQIIIRTLCRYIPFERFSFLGEKGWHDSISKTKVISLKS